MKKEIPFNHPLKETEMAIESVIKAGKAIMEVYNQKFSLNESNPFISCSFSWLISRPIN